MKKMVLGMILGMIISAIVSGVYIHNITEYYESELTKVDSYEDEIKRLSSNYEGVFTDYVQVSEDYEELMNEVYKMMNGKSYDFHIKHGSETHYYNKSKGEKSHLAIKFK